MTLVAYHNDPKLKAGLLASLKAHAEADKIVHGQYWEDGKGCAVGCTLEFLGHDTHSDHMAYESKLGIPVMLARLEDCIFEGLSNGKAQAWPIKFSRAIKPGADLSLVGWKFQYWLLKDSDLLDDGGNEEVRAAIKQCADVLAPLTKGKAVNESAARSAARSAAESAESAARSAARSAAESAESAARSAEFAAESAARSAARSAAESAARSAAWSAESAARSAAWSAARSAEFAAYEKMAEKLLALLRAAR